MKKKPYTAPTLTQHGDAVKQTTGLSGRYWELYTARVTPNGKD